MGVKPGVAFVVAARVSEVKTRAIPPTVKKGRCCVCGTQVYLTAASRRGIAAGKMQPVCAGCMAKIVLASGGMVQLGSPPGGKEEKASWTQAHKEN